MKLICNTERLSEACLNVGRAVSAKSSIPAIEGILLSTKDQILNLTGYDLEVGINTSIPATVLEPGEIIINAKLLYDIIRKLPGDTVELETDPKQMATIRSGEAEYSLIGIDAEEYPELPSVTGGSPVVMEQGLLKNMVRQTIFAVAVNDSKPVHTGIRFELSKGQIKLIAVDGYRLAFRCEQISYDGEEMQFVVPGKTLSEINKLLDEEETISIFVGKRHIAFNTEEYNVVSRLLDGEFLDYNAAIPTSANTTVKVNKRLFTDSIERTSLLITDRLKSPVRCVFNQGIIKVSTTTALGRAFDKTPAEVDGNRLEIGFNNRYLLDALHAVEEDEIKIELNGELAPMKILPLQGDSFLFLVLPVRLKHESES